MDLLLTMVNELPNVSNLESYLALHQRDPEHDFFNNIVHVLVSRMYIFQSYNIANKKYFLLHMRQGMQYV